MTAVCVPARLDAVSSPTEIAAQTFVAAWKEPDAATRARLLDACFAPDGRIVSPGNVIRGRAALAAAIDGLHG